MLILTHKAIARMAGYRVESAYTYYPNMHPPFNKWSTYYRWLDRDDELLSTDVFEHENDVWEACCIVNGLIDSD